MSNASERNQWGCVTLWHSRTVYYNSFYTDCNESRIVFLVFEKEIAMLANT